MASGLTIRVDGVDYVIGYMDMVQANMTGAILTTAEEGAKAIRDRARSMAPVRQGGKKNGGKGKGKGPGYLRRKIVVKKGKYGITFMVQAKAPHAPLQEFGTKRGVKKKLFMERAEEELLPVVQSSIITAAGKEVK